jgi:hypothetical protein
LIFRALAEKINATLQSGLAVWFDNPPTRETPISIESAAVQTINPTAVGQIGERYVADLSWDSRSLAFHKTDRPVPTANAMQVRQPIYDTAIGRWRVYRENLGPLLLALSIIEPTADLHSDGAESRCDLGR